MIPRLQTVIFAVLVLASLAMAGMLFHMREKAHERLLAGQDSAPTKAPEVAAPEQATLMVAHDDDNSIRAQIHSLPLPADPEAKARAVLEKLLELYAAPDAAHPVPGGAGSVAQVFLLPVEQKAAHGGKASPVESDSGAELAVVNLKSSFVAAHPAGLETETLTVLSICSTLKANLPRVTQVRFLVDGEVRESLAGHADLTQTFVVTDPVQAPLEVVHP